MILDKLTEFKIYCALLLLEGTWNDEDWFYARKFVCNYPQNPTPSIAAIRNAYKLVATKKTYDEAQSHCRATYGTDLATVSNLKQNTLIFNLGLYSETHLENRVWIGFDDLTTEGTFRWKDGTQVTFTNWINGPDNAHGTEHMTEMHLSFYGKWNDVSAHIEHNFVCNYRRFASVYRHKLNWNDANTFCQQKFGTQLATITNAGSYNAAKHMSLHNNDNSGIWFGLKYVCTLIFQIFVTYI